MPFQKGQSGNPSGRPLSRPWRDAIERALALIDKGERAKRLDRIAQQLVASALSGDPQSIKEIGDRLDGKPAQQQIVTGDAQGGPMRMLVSWIGETEPDPNSP